MDKNKLIGLVLEKLKKIPNITAIVIGGSYASDTQRPDSDIDLGLYYRENKPFKIESIKELAKKLNDFTDPIVSDFGGWGAWVNGGTWLTIKGQRLDFIYRNLDFVELTINNCLNGKYKSDYYQEPPYGFHSYIYCTETRICKILFDPENAVAKLRELVKEYPPKLKTAIINGFLWDTEFALSRAKSFAARNEIYLVSGSLTRIAHDLIQVAYALNETYFISVKKAYKDIPNFKYVPENFLNRIEEELSSIGKTNEELLRSLQKFSDLIEDYKLLAKNIYVPKYK